MTIRASKPESPGPNCQNAMHEVILRLLGVRYYIEKKNLYEID